MQHVWENEIEASSGQSTDCQQCSVVKYYDSDQRKLMYKIKGFKRIYQNPPTCGLPYGVEPKLRETNTGGIWIDTFLK